MEMLTNVYIIHPNYELKRFKTKYKEHLNKD